MKTYVDRSERDRSFQVTTEVFDREVLAAMDPSKVILEVRSQLAEKITDMIWEKLELGLKATLKESE
jgi:hypothetical protein